MQKFLRTLTLMAFLAMPWVVQGQNANVSEYDASYSTATYTSVSTAGGNALTFTDGEATVTMPFAMYFGTTQIASGATLTVSNNGSVSFADIDGSYIAPLRYAAGYTGGTVYALSTGSKLTIEWRKVTQGSNIYSFQLCLYPSGNIEYRYGPMTLVEPIQVLVGMRSVSTDYFRLIGEGYTSYWNTMFMQGQNSTTRSLSSVYHPDYTLATNTGVVYTFTKPACVKPTIGSASATAWNKVTVNWSNTSTPDSYQIAYSTSDIDFNTAAASDYTVASGTVAATATSGEVTVTAPSTTYYFAVRAKCGNNYSFWSNSTQATTPSGCPSLSAFGATGVTATGATLGWTASVAATSYDVRYNLGADFEPADGEGTLVTSTTASKALTGLTGASTYYYYVRAHCVSGIETDWYGPYTFNTACGAQNVPYTQTFADASMPTCWSEEVVDGDDNWTYYNGYVRFTYSDGSVSRLITPFFNLSTTGAYQVEFDHAECNDGVAQDSLIVYYRTSATGNWVRLQDFGNGADHNNVQLSQAIIALPNPSATYQLAFEGQGHNGYYVYLTNVVVRTQPTCPAPTGIAATSEGVVSWTAGTNNTSYDLVYGPAGFTSVAEGTLVENVTGTTYTIPGLAGSTSYDVYVRAHCSATNETSEGWVGPASFTTPCMSMPLPYTMEFENTNCWTLISNNTVNASTTTTSSNYFGTLTYDSKSVLVFNSWSTASDYFQYAYSPQLNTSNVTGDNIRLTIRYSTRANTDPVRFGYTTTANSTDPSDYTWTSDFLTGGYTDWQTYEAIIPKTATNVAINYASTGCNYKAYIDYVIVDVPPTCFKPTNLAAVPNATANSVTASLSWTENSATPATQWEVRYWKAGTTDTVSVVANTNNAFVLNYLDMATTYNWQVRSICSAEDQSEWSDVSSFSIPECLTGPVTIGNGTASTTGVPVANYGSTYCQQIFTAAELAAAGLTAGEINSLSFYWSAVESSYDKYFSIYMAHTTQSSFESTSSFVPFSNLTMVYGPQFREHGTMSTGVEVFNFTTNFVWDGTSNIVVATLMNAGSNDGNANTRARSYNTGVNNISMFARKDGSQYTEEQLATITGSSRSTYRANIVFNPNAPCYQGDCVPPTVAITTGPDGDNAKADLTFTGDEDAFGYVYGPQGFTPSIANGTTVMGNTATITPLVPETTYDLYVYSVCSGVSTPRMVRYSFTTPFVPNCKPQANFATTGVTYTGATLTWAQEDPNQVPESWTLRYAVNDMVDLEDATTYTEVTIPGAATASYTFSGLHNGDVVVYHTMATCIAAQNDMSAWSAMQYFQLPTIEAPTALANTATTNSSDSLSWTEPTEGINSWTVAYATADFDPTDPDAVYETLAATSNKVKLTGLDAFTTYYVYVRANSGDEHSDWSALSTFRTMCPDGGEVIVEGGDRASNDYLPTDDFYRYAYTQQIVTADEMGGATTIYGVKFNFAHTVSMSSRTNAVIYLGHTSKDEFASTTDWVDGSTLTQVYAGSLNCSNGWNEFIFDTPFEYNGTDNLVIAIDDNSYNYDGSAFKFYTRATTTYKALAYRSDSNNPDPLNPPTASTRPLYRSDMAFVARCNTDVTCFAPASLTAVIDSSNRVTLTWAARTDLEPIVNDFDVNYGVRGFDPDGATQNLVHVGNVTTYQFTALPSTEYDVYVRTHCSDADQSSWTKAQFESWPSVFAPTNVHTTGNTSSSVSIAWTEMNPTPATNWQVTYGLPGTVDLENPVNLVNTASASATVGNLRHNTAYEFYVRAVKGTVVSPWSAVCVAKSDCGVYQYEDMPLVENFDGYTGNTSTTVASHVMPDCWSYINTGTSYAGLPSIYSTSSYSYSTPNTLHFYAGSAAAYSDQYAVLPQFGFNLDTLEVSLFVRFGSNASQIVVGVMSDPADASTFVSVDTVKAPSTGYSTQTEYNVSFKDYTGSARYVAFKAPKPTSGTNYLYMDDLSVRLREKVNRASDLGGTYAICNEFVMPAANTTTGYNGNVNATYVVRPAEAGKVVKLSGSYDLEYGYDFVYVYEGEGANRTIVDTLTGSSDSYEFTTTSNDWVNHGAVTLVFHTDADNAMAKEGFKFLAQCVCPQAAADTVVTSHQANGTYTWHGISRDNSNVPYEAAPSNSYVLEYAETNVAGCDSVYLRDSLLLHPTYRMVFDNRHICERDTFDFMGQQFTATGNYEVTLQTVHGGDSVGVLNLQMHTAPTAGIYYNGRNVTTIEGFCDNANLDLTARSSDNAATFLWEDSTTGATRTVNPHLSATYTVVATDATAYGCTSLPATLSVTTTPVAEPTITATDTVICRLQSTTLSVADASELEGVTFRWSTNETGNSITVTPDVTTTYTVTATTTTGCATTASQTITVNQLPEVELSTSVSEVCRDSAVTLTATTVDGYNYAWNNGATTAQTVVNPNTTNSYTVTVTDANGCVKDFTTSTVTVNPSYNMDVEASECVNNLPYTFGTQSLSVDGLYHETFAIAHGCDSIVNLTFTVQDTAVFNSYRELCYGTAFTFGEGIYQQNYTAEQTGVITYLDTTSGCPAIYNLYLTVNMPAATSFDTTVCDLMTWNATEYTTTGVYNQTLATTKACDSVVTMNLVVNYSNTGIDNQDVCDQLVWIDGITYTEPNNEAQFTVKNVAGCDSLVTLNLTAVRHATEGVDDITFCDAFSYTWIDGNDYELSETDGGIRYTLPGVTNAQGCDTTAILNLVMNPVRDSLVWRDTVACDELVFTTRNCYNEEELTSIRESGDYMLRVHNDAANRDEIMRLHVTINTSTPMTTIATGCLPYTWTITLPDESEWQYIVKEEDHVGENTIFISKEIAATADGCSHLAMLRLTAMHPVVQTVEHVMCENTSWDTLGHTFYASELKENDDYTFDFTRALTEEGCDSTLRMVFTVLDSAKTTVYDTLYEGQFVENEENGNFEYAWVSQTNVEDTLILTLDNGRYTQQPYDGAKTAVWNRENGCDSTVTVIYHVIPTLYSFDDDTTVCTEFVWERDGRTVGTVTLNDEAVANGYSAELIDTLKSKQYEYDSLVVKIVNFYYPDTTWMPEQNVCTEYEFQGVTYFTDSTFFVQAGPNKNGCDSVVAYRFKVIGSRLHDFNIVTNEPYKWYNDDVDTTYKQSTQKYVDWTMGGCDQVLHLNLTIVDNPITYCADDNNVAVIEFTNDSLVPSELYELFKDQSDPVRLVNTSHHSGDLSNAPYTYNDTLMFFYIRPVYNQTIDTVSCGVFTWNGIDYADTGIYTQNFVSQYGCDSTVTMNLWINNHAASDSNWVVERCDEFNFHYEITYDVAGNDTMPAASWNFLYDSTFKASTETTVVLKNAYGCDSIVNLSLTINKNTPVVVRDTACDLYTWTVSNNAASETAGTYSYASDESGDFEYAIEATDANGCVATDSLYLFVKHSVHAAWDTLVNGASYTYKNRFFQAPADVEFFDTLATAQNGCDSILDVHIIVNAGDAMAVTKNSCGLYTWTAADHGNGHTYKWISAAESAANGNALYKDITNSDSVVYIHTGSEPMEQLYTVNANGDSVLMMTYVLHLNLLEAGFGDTTIARYPISMGNTIALSYGDSLQTVSYTIPENKRPTWNNTSVQIDTTLYFEYADGGYYCGNYVDLHLTAVHNYDTAAAIVNCYEVDSMKWNGVRYDIPVGDSNEYTIATGTGYDVQYTTYYVTRKSFVGSTIADSVVCSLFQWNKGDNDSIYTESTTNVVTRIAKNGCDSVVTILNLTVNTVNNQSLAATGCDSIFWADKGANGKWYYATTTDTIQYKDANNCLVVDTMKLTVVPTVHHMVLDTTVCDSYTWHEASYTATGKYAYDYTTDSNGVTCHHADTLKLTVNNSIETYPDSLVFGENFRMDGQLYTAPFSGIVVRNLQTVAGCDSTANVNLTVSFYTDENVVREACGVYEWIAADNGNGHYYRSITDEESAANGNALYYDETDGAYVTANPVYTPVRGQANYGYRYHLQLSLYGAVFSEKDTTFLLSNNNGIMTYNGEDFDYSALLTAKTGKDTIHAVRFGAVAGACDSIQTLTVHVVYNYTHSKETVCAENGNTLSWRNKTWNIGAPNSTVTLVDTANKNTQQMWIYTHDVTRRAAIATTATPVDVCDQFVWGGETFTKDTNNVSKTFTSVLTGCDSVVTIANIVIRHSSQYDSTKVICDQFQWTERSDSLYKASTVDTVTIVNAAGCDSLQILHLTINKNLGSNITVNACDEYTWKVGNNTIGTYINNGNDVNQSGSYYNPSTDANGCQAFDTLILVVNASSHVADTEYVGEGSVRYNGRLYVAPAEYFRYDTTWADDTHTEFVPNAVGCYNITDVLVKVGNFYHRDEMYVKCNSFTWPVNGHTYNWISADERAANGNALYYDATAEEYVTVNPTYTIANEGDYDSIIMLMLTLTQNTTSTDEVTFPVSLAYLHYGDSTFNYTAQRDLALNGGNFAGYEDVRDVHFASVEYCDSVVTVSVHVVNNYTQVATDDICATQTSYTWRGHEISTVTTDYDNLHYYYVYDTVGTEEEPVVEYIKVAQHPVVYAVERRYACDSYEWNGETFTESVTNYTKFFENGSSYGCDSTVVLHLTVYNTTSALTEETVCDTYTWTAANGDFTRTYTQSIDTIVRYDNVYQYKTCHSADTLRLTVNHKQTHTETVSACDSYDMYTYDVATETYVVDTTFNTDTTGYVRVLTNMNGCDSTVTLNLTIRHSSPVVDSVAVACGSFTANSGAVYYTSGIYFDTIMNVAQCDSVTKFTVTINNGAKNDYAFVCDSISWHDSTYAIAGTYTFSVNDQCADTLVIGEVRLATHDVYTDTACNNYTWTFTNNMYDYVGDSVLYDYEDSRYYTTGGVKTNNYVNTVGCPSVDTLNLTINRRSFAEDVVTACGSYDWYVNDSLIGTFTQSIETQTSFFNNTTKCDSVTFLKLTILEAPVVDTAAAICQSALPYTWRGTEMTEAGVESVVFPMENGCDSTVRFTLTVNPVYETNLTAQVCLGQGYNENNFDIAASELPEAGEYTFTDNLQTVNGCDSVVTLTVTVGNILTNVIEVASCDSYVWNGTVYTQSGDYTHSYNNDMGCASVDTLRLTINVNHGVTENQTVCTSYSWNGTEYTEAGTYRVHFADENGCFGDSVLNLSIAPTEQLSYERSACESYTWSDGDGETYTESGTYTYEYTNAEGCNGIATLYLTVNNAEPTNTAIVACNSYSWNGTVYTESGVYTSETTDENGCTAVDTLTLTLNSSLAESIDATVCGIYVWNGMAYNESGSYQQTFTSVNGCDSVVTLNLTINEAITSAISEETCGSYTWNGISYSASGVYTQTFSTESGCDSVVTLTLTIGNVATSDTAATACGSFEWHGTTYSQSGVYTYTYNEEGGCDSIVTLTLTINTPANTTESAVACDSYTWNGQTYTTSGVYTHSFTDANGCEATATLNLTINEGGNTVVNETVCDSYTLNGMTYTTSGVYTQPTVSENGCVGTITLNLTVNESVNVTETVEACGSYTWNGTTYTTSQTFSSTTTGSNGCDSTTTVVLTINNAQTVAAAPVSACGSYAWNGQIITTSGNYSYTTTGSNGCDSTTTINVTIHNTTYGDTTAVACGSFVWNGVAYTQSGSYQNVEAYTSVNGCDSIVTLNLTINNPVDVVVDETACDSYTWTVDGQTYTTSGTYVSPVMQTVNGCDSTVTLNLTVNHSSSYAVTTSAVGSYEWNGETYTESGVYTWTGTNAEGCDSTVTLNLTVTPATYTVIIGVNDPMMGNVTNGGMREVAAGETITVTASPNVGYHFVDWSNGSTDATITVVVTSDTTLTANFAVNTYVIEAVASDATMGTVTGSGEYTYGATVVLEATANAGYRFVRWSTGETDAHIEFVATEDLSVIAYFESVGIDDVDDNTVEIYSTDSRIIVKGAENKDVYVYDVNGRCVRRQAKATETIEFTMSVSGVYLVKVGDMPAKRVVVVR